MSKAIGRLLRAAGYRAELFASAEACLQTDAAETATCLVLDVHLPGLSGFELTRLLLAAGSRSPVIFITAHDEEGVRDEAKRLGCAAYLRKPFEGSVFLEEIRRALHSKTKCDDKVE